LFVRLQEERESVGIAKKAVGYAKNKSDNDPGDLGFDMKVIGETLRVFGVT
jgi:hypothetical protein